MKVRESGRIVSVAVIIAVGLNSDGRREVLGMAVVHRRPSRSGPSSCVRSRAVACAASSSSSLMPTKARGRSPRCCRRPGSAVALHFMRNALAHVGPSQRPMVAAAIRTAFTQETAEAVHQEWRAVADRLREPFRKLAELMDEAEHDVLAHMAFPKHHWRQLHSTKQRRGAFAEGWHLSRAYP